MLHFHAVAFLAIAAVCPSSALPVECDSQEGLDLDTQEISLLQTEMQLYGVAGASLSPSAPKEAGLLQGEALAEGKVWAAHGKTASGTAHALAYLHRLSEMVKANVTIWFFGLLLLASVSFMAMTMAATSSRQHGQSEETSETSKEDPFLAQPFKAAASRSPPLRGGLSPKLTSPGLNSPKPLSSQQTFASPLMASSGRPSDAEMQAASLKHEAEQAISVPPICPSLVLPSTEARFMIDRASVDFLIGHEGSFDIKGTSGKKLLHGMKARSPDNRTCLMVSSCGCEDDPRVCIFSSQLAELEVFGKAGKFYGWLKQRADNTAVLYHNGPGGDCQEVMQLQMTDKMCGDAYSMSGQLLGTSSYEHHSWKLQAKPGTDAVLLASCMIAMSLMPENS